jgi:MFS family permease
MNSNIFWLYAISILVYFGQGIASLPGTAFFFYLKETLHFDEQKIMYLGSLVGLAWLVKPIWGYLIDSLGISKKIWLLISISLSLILTLSLGFLTALPVIVGAMILLSWSGAVRDVTVDGMMCVQGKKHNITGKIQSLQWMAITIASILTGFSGGWLADHASYQTCYLILVPFFILMLFMASKYTDVDVTYNIKRIGITPAREFYLSMKELFKDKNLLLACGFLFLYNFSPAIGTPLAFIQRDTFHWSKTFMGTLGTIGAIASVFGAWLYYHFSKRLDLKVWLVRSVWIGASTTLCYLWFTPITCIIYDVVFSVIGMFLTLMVLDFMARESKTGMEAMAFALLCSITNLTSTLNGFVGGWLFPIVGLKWLIIISAFTSFLCLPLIKRLKI